MSHSPYIVDGYHSLNILGVDGYVGNYSIGANLTITGTTTASGVVTVPQGTLASPGMVLASSTNSGIYWDSTHSALALASQGNQVFYTLASGSIQFVGSLGVSGNFVTSGYIAGASNFFVQSYTKGITIRQNSLSANTSGIVIQQGYALTPLTANATLVTSGSTNNASASDTNGVFTNTGATGAITVTLPNTSSTVVGFVHIFIVTVAQTVTITAGGTDKINSGSLGGHATTSTVVIGMSLELVCTSTNNWTTRIINSGPAASPGVWAFT